jgi:hypothetical protein
MGLRNDGAIGSFYLGQALNLQGQYREALGRCIDARGPMLEKFGEAMESALLLCRGEALLGLRRTGEAIAALDASVASAKKTGDPADLRLQLRAGPRPVAARRSPPRPGRRRPVGHRPERSALRQRARQAGRLAQGQALAVQPRTRLRTTSMWAVCGIRSMGQARSGR